MTSNVKPHSVQQLAFSTVRLCRAFGADRYLTVQFACRSAGPLHKTLAGKLMQQLPLT